MKNFNWNNLKEHLGSRDRSFEELSKQLFRKEYAELGVFREIGAPGQSQNGVEAIIEQQNDDEIGMQAKWFYPGTVKQSNRKKQIEDSLKKASERAKLKRWILCTPLIFDDGDWTWWNGLKSQYPNITIENPWLNSELIGRLAKQENYGMKGWFFGELEFDQKQFETKIRSSIDCLSQKYLPSLHVAGNADERIQVLLGNKTLIDNLEKGRKTAEEWSGKLKELQKVLNEASSELKNKVVYDLVRDLDQKLIRVDSDLKEYEKKIQTVIEEAKAGNLTELGKRTLEDDLLTEKETASNGYQESVIIKLLRKILHRECSVELKVGGLSMRFATVGWLDDDKKFLIIKKSKKEIEISLKGDNPDNMVPELAKELKKNSKELNAVSGLQEVVKKFVETEFRSFRKELDRVSTEVSDIYNHFEELNRFTYWIGRDLEYFQEKEVIFLANPAVGKTHLVLKACERQLEEKKPAILILGSQITNQDYLKKQVIDRLELNSGFTWEQIIQALESYAEANKTRILFAFDALNESPYWENIVKDGLDDLIKPLLNSDWFGVVITSRSSYAIPLFGDEHPQHGFFLRNDMDIEEYRKAYFQAYKLTIKDISPSIREHLDDRFFVTLTAKVYGDPKADKPKEISLKDLTINNLLEDFISKIDGSVCRKLKAPTGCQLVRRKITSLCGYMFENNLVQLSKYKALELVDGKDPSLVRNDDSWLHCMVDEGLLVDFTWKNGIEILEFSHQRVAEYLMARYVVDGKSQSEIKELIGLHSNHPRILDVLEIVGTLTPQLINKHLHEFLPSNDLTDHAQISAFFEMKTIDISESEINWLNGYFMRSSIQKRQLLLTRLSYSVFFEACPFNGKYTSKLLNDLSMKDRDLVWTEWVREHTTYGGELSDLPTEFEEAVKTDKITQERAILGAEYLKWFLTSTNRDIRDRTTRALYWFGRKYPNELFKLTINSLGINDHYVPERLLAASYGINMAFYGSVIRLTKEVLQDYTTRLYQEMFSPGAKNTTTHILMRDYARRTIELSLIQSPRLLNKSQKKKIKSPFKTGGIRKWGELEDKNEHEYRGGNYPLGFDWGNYTLGRIVPNRSPYQDTEEFKKVRRQIFWRIYDLGYSLHDFGEIDKEIASRDHSYRSDVPGKTERYGKKYCWIAYFELAGYRADKGLLREDWEVRGSEVDIDPSFPEAPPKIKILTDSLIDKKITTEQWVKQQTSVNIDKVFIQDGVGNVDGKWVLLDGTIGEEDKTSNKGLLIRVVGALVNEIEAKDLTDLYMRKKKDERGRNDDIPDPESDYYTFVGEIPWCETFPKTVYPQTMEFTLSDKKIVKKKIKIVIPSFFAKEKGKPEATSYEQEVLDYKEMEKQGIIRKIKVMIPVRNFSWESYHCKLNQAGGVTVVNKEISCGLKLRTEPQGFDLIDNKGNKASISTEYGSSWTNGHEMIFLREDLLNVYLRKKKKSLVWLIWGERQFEPTKDYLSGGERETEEFRKKIGNNLTRYKQAIIYKPSS